MIVVLHVILIRFYVTNLNNSLQEVVKNKLSVKYLSKGFGFSAVKLYAISTLELELSIFN
jgi:hypothetical protein